MTGGQVPPPSGLATIGEEQRLQLLFDAVHDYAICMLDEQGRILSWNPGAAKLKGYAADEIIGKPFSIFYTPEDREARLPEVALHTARDTGHFHAENWRVRKDGSRFLANVVIDAVHGPDGTVIGYAKITRDVTERYLAQQELLESERAYRRLVDAVVDYAIFQLDPEGRITTWNRGAERIKGYSRAEVIGRHFSIFYPAEDRATGAPDKALAAARASGRYAAEGWRVRKDGSRFWALIVIDAIYDDDNQLIGFAKITRDITERREADLKLKATQEQLASAQKMEAVGQLSGGIAHDFNNLMMIVMGNLENAQNHLQRGAETSGVNPAVARAIGNAMRGAQRAAALTSRLLAFSRRQPLDPKPIKLDRFISGSVDFLQRSLGERVKVEVEVAPNLAEIEADPNQLEAALVNLSINARDAMPDGGTLRIEASNVERVDVARLGLPSRDFVLIKVRDTGTGIDNDILNRVFEPFFTTKELGHGTGLGLSQVYGFVKQSGGHIHIDSEVGEGTTVSLCFPHRPPDSISRSSEAERPSPVGTLDNEVILLAEDDNDLRGFIADVLQQLRYRVFQAGDADAALRLIENKDVAIDLLLTDVVMRGRNGEQLAQEARRYRPDLKVLFMTGYARDAFASGGQPADVLQKPISQAELATRVRVMLDRDRVQPAF